VHMMHITAPLSGTFDAAAAARADSCWLGPVSPVLESPPPRDVRASTVAGALLHTLIALC
jgi:hypothetical protein